MIEPFLGNELSSAAREEFMAHVRGCKTCRDELEVYYVVYSVVSQLDNDTDDGLTDYRAELKKMLERSEGNARAHRVFIYVLEILLALAITAVSILLAYQGG